MEYQQRMNAQTCIAGFKPSFKSRVVELVALAPTDAKMSG
jgi:hypothetical protein